MTTLNAASASSLVAIRLGFDALIDPSTLTPFEVVITPSLVTSAEVAAYYTLVDLTPLGASVVVTPPLSSGQSYTVEVDGVLDAAGNPVTGSILIVAPSIPIPRSLDTAPWGPLRALTQALGDELQERAGRPETRLLHAYTPGDGEVILESTIGFFGDGLSPGGAVFVDGRRLTFAGIDVSGHVLTGVRDPTPDGEAIPSRSEVILDVDSILPT